MTPEMMNERLEREAIVAALSGFEPRDAPADRAGDLRPASVALAVGGPPGDRRLLLTVRPTTMRRHAGQFALPGGRVDPGETDPDAARRELHEEIGIETAPADVLGRLDDYVTRSGYRMRPYVVWLGDRLGELSANPDEVATVFEVTATELDVTPSFVDVPESTGPLIRWPFRGFRVHAPTAAVIYQFREVALHGRPTRVGDLDQPFFAWR